MDSTVVSDKATSRWTKVLELAATVTLLCIGAGMFWRNQTNPAPAVRAASASAIDLSVPTTPISIEGDEARGSTRASVVLIEYSDFQCPFCARAALNILPEVIKEYVDTGVVLLVFKHLPLQFHTQAAGAAAASVCAAQQGKFWEAHDALFADSRRLGEEDLRDSMSRIGVNMASYDSCRKAKTADERVEANRSEAARLGISGTPAFLVGHKIDSGSTVRIAATMAGARPIAEFRKVLDSELRQVGSKR